MKTISLLIKPASSLCNMRCRYCFYADVSANRTDPSMGIMKKYVMEALIMRTMETDAETINYCFQGGEPTVAGVEYFEAFIDYVNQHNNGKTITYAIQTNGTLLNEKWVKLFAENHFLVGLSVDGFKRNHDHFRKDGQNKGTYTQILYNIRALVNAKVDFNILTVLTHELSKHPDELFAFYKENKLDYVQLIPCLPSLNFDASTDRYALTPRDFASFYKRLFDLWFDEYCKGHYISVTLFDNVIPMYRGVPPQQCGMLGQCAMQFVIEGNGNVYPCDFYVLDQYLCGNVKTDTLETIMHHENAKKFLMEPRRSCSQCADCPFGNICHRNCKRLNICYFDDHYCGYRDFLQYSMKKMQMIASTLKMKNQ